MPNVIFNTKRYYCAGSFHYNPEEIKPAAIEQASASGDENQLLGLGSHNKADLLARVARGEKPVAVVERAPDGTEVRTAAGTEGTAAEQLAAMDKAKSKGNTVAVEPIDKGDGRTFLRFKPKIIKGC